MVRKPLGKAGISRHSIPIRAREGLNFGQERKGGRAQHFRTVNKFMSSFAFSASQNS